jgi:hypothetical protein
MPWFGLYFDRQMGAASPVTSWDTNAIQCSLHTVSQTVNVDTDDFFNDWSGSEVSGTNYTALGVTLGSKTSVYDTGTDETRLDAADAIWTTVTIAAFRYALIWENTAGASTTDPLLVYFDTGAQTVTAANLTIQFDATGVCKVDTT